jgi:hypothetical protein
MTPNEKLLKLLAKNTIIVKNIMKDFPLNSILETMWVVEFIQRSMYTINKEVGEKTITYTNMEDEHNDDQRNNLASTNDDDNIHVNILHLCFS